MGWQFPFPDLSPRKRPLLVERGMLLTFQEQTIADRELDCIPLLHDVKKNVLASLKHSGCLCRQCSMHDSSATLPCKRALSHIHTCDVMPMTANQSLMSQV